MSEIRDKVTIEITEAIYRNITPISEVGGVKLMDAITRMTKQILSIPELAEGLELLDKVKQGITEVKEYMLKGENDENES